MMWKAQDPSIKKVNGAGVKKDLPFAANKRARVQVQRLQHRHISFADTLALTVGGVRHVFRSQRKQIETRRS